MLPAAIHGANCMRLRARGIPLALHADLGNDAAPTRYLPLMEEVLCLYPENVIVWVHMGLSRELTAMAAAQHVALMMSLWILSPS